MGAAREKIAILGGGVGALSAAFYITEEPDWAERYEITVYQQGWRLGGKCASGHDLRPGYGDRIYEHGLHIFAGFYDQAFDLLRRAYEVLDRPDDHPNRTVWDAFSPQDAIALVDANDPFDRERVWYMDFGPNEDVPGEDLSVAPPIVMIQRMVALMLHGSPQKLQPLAPSTAGPSAGAPGLLHEAWSWLCGFARRSVDDLKEVAAEAVVRDVMDALESYMTAIDSTAWSLNSKLQAERFLLSAYLVQSVLHGVRADEALTKGYDVLDKYEWSEWLFRNAVEVAKTQNPRWGDPAERAQQLVDWAPIATLYDYVFGFGDSGDVAKRSFAAGTALRSGLLMISYKGHFFWKMRGAMGDVVIAPLYLALAKRGVKFQFFSRITALNIDPEAPRLSSIDYVRQVELKDGGYRPLIGVPIPGWPADRPLEGWPAEPLWEQIVDGDRLQAAQRRLEDEHNDAPDSADRPCRLKLGEDFDKVVLGISVGGLKQVCASFPARLPESNWGPMFGALTLTRTCAMQLWLTRTAEDLGCGAFDRTLTGAAQPYSSWSDMSHLLARETWNGADRPRAIVYFCGQIPGGESAGAANRSAYDLAVEWLKSSAATYWPRATSPASPYGLDPALLYDPEPQAGGDVLTRQYVRANCAPSDLYVQSPKNSVYTRMDADQSGLSNLFLAGDWTRNGVNSGCAESAARSGWRCAQAVFGKLPPLPD